MNVAGAIAIPRRNQAAEATEDVGQDRRKTTLAMSLGERPFEPQLRTKSSRLLPGKMGHLVMHIPCGTTMRVNWQPT